MYVIVFNLIEEKKNLVFFGEKERKKKGVKEWKKEEEKEGERTGILLYSKNGY